MTRAIILCAGWGKRMGEYTQNCPKPLLPLHGKPLLEYAIKNLVKHDIREIGINLHYKAEQIETYFGNGSFLGASITYVQENAPSGTAGGVKKLEHFLQSSDPFLVLYGDLLTNQNLSELINIHRQKAALGTIILHRRKNSNSMVHFDQDGKISFFLERPTPEQRERFPLKEKDGETWVNSGIYCLAPEVLSQIPANQFCDFPKDIFPLLIKRNGLFGHPLSGYRWAIDTPDKYQDALRGMENHHE